MPQTIPMGYPNHTHRIPKSYQNNWVLGIEILALAILKWVLGIPITNPKTPFLWVVGSGYFWIDEILLAAI